MSLILCQPSREGYIELLCSKCKIPIGQLSLKEAAELSYNGMNPLCFECEPGGADDIPSQLVSQEDVYLVGIGTDIFLAEHLKDDFWNLSLRFHRISYTTFFDLKTGLGPKYAKTPLASSLNFNSTHNNRG